MEKVCISSSGESGMAFSICFRAGGQMFPGTLAVPCPAITAASATTAVATRAKTVRVRFMLCPMEDVDARLLQRQAWTGCGRPYFAAIFAP